MNPAARLPNLLNRLRLKLDEMPPALGDDVLDHARDQVANEFVRAAAGLKMRVLDGDLAQDVADHGEPRTPDDLHQHRLLGLTTAAGATPEWTFPPPYTARRLKLHFAMLFNSAEAPVIAATAGLGIAHTGDLLSACRSCNLSLYFSSGCPEM